MTCPACLCTLAPIPLASHITAFPACAAKIVLADRLRRERILHESTSGTSEIVRLAFASERYHEASSLTTSLYRYAFEVSRRTVQRYRSRTLRPMERYLMITSLALAQHVPDAIFFFPDGQHFQEVRHQLKTALSIWNPEPRAIDNSFIHTALVSELVCCIVMLVSCWKINFVIH